MKYYLHDTNSFNDEKITELYEACGYEGLGLFYTILEKLAMQEKPIKTTVLKKQLFVGKKLDKCWKIMEELGLIASTQQGTFSKTLTQYITTYNEKNKKNKEKVSQWRENQEHKKTVTSYNPITEPAPNPPNKTINKNKETKETDYVGETPAPPPYQTLLSQSQTEAYHTLETIKQKLLQDQVYTATLARLGIAPHTIPRWMDAFHRRLIFTGKHHKQETDYRTHLPQWIKSIPNYTTLDPDQYEPVTKPQPPPATPTLSPMAQELRNLINEKETG